LLKKAQQKVPAKKMASFSATRFADSGRVFQRQYELSTEIWNIWEKVIQNMTNKEENLPYKPTAKDWDNILGLRYVSNYSCKILELIILFYFAIYLLIVVTSKMLLEVE
jgi:hypothetical protein